MYHIKNDKRSQKSAEKITLALYKCLDEKPFEDISVSEISRIAEVGRATFYRLYDNPTDILAYQCDQVLNKLIIDTKNNMYPTNYDVRVGYIERWLKEKQLIKALSKSKQESLIINMHMRRCDELEKIFYSSYTAQISIKLKIFLSSMLLASAIELDEKSHHNFTAGEIYNYIKATLIEYLSVENKHP